MAKAATKNEASVSFTTEQTIIYLERSDLNDAGLEMLEAYRAQHGEVPVFKVNGVPTEHLPVGVSFPYPEGGLAQHIEPNFLAAWEAKWNAEVMSRGIKVELDVDKFVKGQARIDLNRDRTPVAIVKFTKATTSTKKGARSTASKPVSTSL